MLKIGELYIVNNKNALINGAIYYLDYHYRDNQVDFGDPIQDGSIFMVLSLIDNGYFVLCKNQIKRLSILIIDYVKKLST